jgi:Na+-translocating ferredoxin:NAD+ oxidoreductase subunit D
MSPGNTALPSDSSLTGELDGATAVSLQIAPSPHLADRRFSTRGMMIEVIVALMPATAVAIWVFGWFAITNIGLCILACLAIEAGLNWLARKPQSVGDYSAVLTGLILGLSLPWSSPWYVGVVGSLAAIGLGKAVFGGLGCNIFNPAMVGRAFVMLSFARELGASAYVVASSQLTVVTEATPLSLAKQFAADLAAGRVTAGDAKLQIEAAESYWALLVGQVNGSLGETSAIAVVLGGVYLLVRRVISWEIPVGILLVALTVVELSHLSNQTLLEPMRHLIAGSLLFGAFFIATDPVTSPVTRWGRFIYGLGIGFFVVVIRVFSSYPEGLMFAVLLMNAAVPLLNRWTIPRPLGGPVPKKG